MTILGKQKCKVIALNLAFHFIMLPTLFVFPNISFVEKKNTCQDNEINTFVIGNLTYNSKYTLKYNRELCVYVDNYDTLKYLVNNTIFSYRSSNNLYCDIYKHNDSCKATLLVYNIIIGSFYLLAICAFSENIYRKIMIDKNPYKDDVITECQICHKMDYVVNNTTYCHKCYGSNAYLMVRSDLTE